MISKKQDHLKYSVMKYTLFTIIVLFLAVTQSYAKGDLDDVRKFISQKEYDKADKLLDKLIKEEPNNVDAFMYKGNIIFYKAQFDGIAVNANENESIYESSIGYISAPETMLSKKEALEIEKYFLKALNIAPERMDIQMGLCYTYANVGLTDRLIKRFPILKKYSADNPDIVYSMGDYARIIIDKVSLEDGGRVFEKIIELYPENGNIYSDLASSYFLAGKLKEAEKFFNKAIKKNPDEKTIQNLVLINTIFGNYEEGLKSIKLLADMDNSYNNDYEIYKFIFGAVKGNSPNKTEFPKIKEIENLNKLFAEKNFKDFLAVESNLKNTNFNILLNEWGVNAFPNKFEPRFKLAEILTYYQNFEKANSIFKNIEEKNLAKTVEDKENLAFYYGWSLYKSGDSAEAGKKWKLLTNSDDFYKKSAAYYFLAKEQLEKDNQDKATDYCNKLSGRETESKYATYCWNIVRVNKE